MTSDLEALINRSVDVINRSADGGLNPGALSWLELPGGRNMDEIPDALCPTSGCPHSPPGAGTCGSVWVDYVAVGFSVRHYEDLCSGEFLIDHGLFWVRPIYPGLPVSVRAVRCRCAEGHKYEFILGDCGVRSANYWWATTEMSATAAAGVLNAYLSHRAVINAYLSPRRIVG